MTSTYTKVASFRAAPRLDTRRPGRYEQLDAHHARLIRRQTLAADRATLAADVTQKQARRQPSSNVSA